MPDCLKLIRALVRRRVECAARVRKSARFIYTGYGFVEADREADKGAGGSARLRTRSDQCGLVFCFC